MDISEKDMVEEYRAWEETLETRNKMITFVIIMGYNVTIRSIGLVIKVIKPMHLDLIKIYRRDDQTVRPFIFWPVRYCGGKKFVKRFGYKLEFLVTTNIDLKYPQIFTSDHQGSLDVPVAAIGYSISFIGSRLVDPLNNINPSMEYLQIWIYIQYYQTSL